MKRRVKSALRRLRENQGQNTVEYMLMLTVVVGVVLIAGASLKKYIPQLVGQIEAMIIGTATSMGSAG